MDEIINLGVKVVEIKLKRLHKDAKIPTYGTEDSACVDLYAIEDYTFHPGGLKRIHSGWSCEIPKGYYVEVYNRSGMASKKQLVIVSSRVIDADYRGEIFTPIKNIGDTVQIINKGDRFAQMLLKKRIYMVFEEVAELTPTNRGSGGFGSTGK